MGRKRAFDLDEVLEKAMNLFWQQGYSATSMNELEQTLGINKFSIYNSFGNKHSLFMQCLDRYYQQRFSLMLSCLTLNVNGLSNIQLFFDTLVMVLTSQPIKIGCFLTNTSLEIGPKDPDIQQRITDSYDSLENGFYQCLLAAKDLQEIDADLPLHNAAHSLLITTQGLLTVGRNCNDPTQLTNTAHFVINGLKKTRQTSINEKP